MVGRRCARTRLGTPGAQARGLVSIMRPAPLLGSAIQIVIEPSFVLEVLIVAIAVVVLFLVGRKR